MAMVVLGRLELDQAIEAIKRATRRFIRAQDVWFRRDAGSPASFPSPPATEHRL